MVTLNNTQEKADVAATPLPGTNVFDYFFGGVADFAR